MTKPLPLTKLPAELHKRAGKTRDLTIRNLLTQAAHALEERGKRVNALQGHVDRLKKQVHELETTPQKPVKAPDLDWSDVDTSDGDWWDADPDIGTLDQGW